MGLESDEVDWRPGRSTAPDYQQAEGAPCWPFVGVDRHERDGDRDGDRERQRQRQTETETETETAQGRRRAVRCFVPLLQGVKAR